MDEFPEAELELEVEEDKKIEPYKQHVKVDHVIGSNNHECSQLCCNTCNEDVVLYLVSYHVHHESRFGNWTKKS